jgi:hypothetical protein
MSRTAGKSAGRMPRLASITNVVAVTSAIADNTWVAMTLALIATPRRATPPCPRK